MLLAIVQHPNEIIGKDDIVNLSSTIKDIICVAYANMHYAVVRYNIDSEMITIYDGLAGSATYNSDKWMTHVFFLQRKFRINGNKLQIKLDTITVSSVMLKQVDGFNCGLIACMVVWKLLSNNHTTNLSEIPFEYT